MGKYKVGDVVTSKYKSPGCAPEGESCKVTGIVPGDRDSNIPILYKVKINDGRDFLNYEDELDPNGCDYCQKGKAFNTVYYGDVSVKSYIMGNQLNTDVQDDNYPGEEDGRVSKITHCPFCGTEVHELPDEEMEEEE